MKFVKKKKKGNNRGHLGNETREKGRGSKGEMVFGGFQ